MTAPLQSFRILSHPLGHLLILKWKLPNEMPDGCSICLFKKKGENFEKSELESYKSGETELNFEVISLSLDTTEYFDYQVENNKSYVYRISIKEEPGFFYDSENAVNALPDFKVNFSTLDTKQLLINCIDIIKGNRKTSKQDFYESQILPHQNPKELEQLFEDEKTLQVISVVRMNQYFDAAEVETAELKAFNIFSFNSVFQEFSGNLSKFAIQDGVKKHFGLIEQDNILIVWRTKHSKDRDEITMIMREARAEILYFLNNHKVMEIRTAMGSDFVEQIQESESSFVYGCSMIIQMRFETEATYVSGEYIGNKIIVNQPKVGYH